MGKVKLVETVLRDAHQSLIATRMRTEDMLPIVEKLDQIGYFSLEAWGGATFDVCIRYLNEDPWERLRLLSKSTPNTPLQMLLRGQNLVGYRHYPDDIVEKFVIKAAENGVDVFRIFDAVNDIRNLEVAIKTAKKMKRHVQGAISFTLSPVYTLDFYVEIGKKLRDLNCDSICIKDMAGLIAPDYAHKLVSRLKKDVGLPVNLHCHCTSGLAPMSYWAACEAGVDILDTAISPFALGTSQPATESIVGALKGTPYDTGLDLELIAEVAEYFKKVREKYATLIDPISERVDVNVLVYQIPGGMLSNLISQLKEQNAMDKYGAVLREVPKVREDLGYPPLVTPTSQIVGTQAVINVVLGERYKIVPKEVRDYVKGLYGKSPAPIKDEIKKKAIGDEEILTCRPADLLKPEYEQVAKKARELGLVKKEEDILTYALYPAVAVKFLKGEAVAEQIPPKKTVKPAFSEVAKKFKVNVNGKTAVIKLEEVSVSEN
jgi:pyruvate carboxylase subunit B